MMIIGLRGEAIYGRWAWGLGVVALGVFLVLMLLDGLGVRATGLPDWVVGTLGKVLAILALGAVWLAAAVLILGVDWRPRVLAAAALFLALYVVSATDLGIRLGAFLLFSGFLLVSAALVILVLATAALVGFGRLAWGLVSRQ